MPTYEYECEACGHKLEKMQKFSDRPLTTCPKCKKRRLRRLIGTGGGIIFKGSGFYETDYKRKGEAASKGDAASKSKAASKGEAACETCQHKKNCES
ncbi:MAG: FmdB family zinc ribbon protein [Planctomycetota bacterium]